MNYSNLLQMTEEGTVGGNLCTIKSCILTISNIINMSTDEVYFSMNKYILTLEKPYIAVTR